MKARRTSAGASANSEWPIASAGGEADKSGDAEEASTCTDGEGSCGPECDSDVVAHRGAAGSDESGLVEEDPQGGRHDRSALPTRGGGEHW